VRSRIANDKEETVIDPLFSCARFLSRSIFRVNEFPFEARIERIRSYSNSSLTVQAREISATDYEDAVKQKQIARDMRFNAPQTQSQRYAMSCSKRSASIERSRNFRRRSDRGIVRASQAQTQTKKLYEPPEPLPNGVVISMEKKANKLIVDSAVFVIDKLYENRDYPRFYALETIARVPYFSFLSVLHLYESFGWWRRADYLKVHFAETMNEYHHLLIMESMGGADSFKDRFFAQHVAVVYFWVAVVIYMVSPRMAYNLSEQVEEHAYQTYDDFLNRKEDELKQTPACGVAVSYFQLGDLYLFDEFQTNIYDGLKSSSEQNEIRRPKIKNMYDVIMNVRNDELEHVKTMSFCQKPGNLLRSSSTVRAQMKAKELCNSEDENTLIDGESIDEQCDILLVNETQNPQGERDCEGVLDCVVKQFK
jgi:ubiquinol oxidase